MYIYTAEGGGAFRMIFLLVFIALFDSPYMMVLMGSSTAAATAARNSTAFAPFCDQFARSSHAKETLDYLDLGP